MSNLIRNKEQLWMKVKTELMRSPLYHRVKSKRLKMMMRQFASDSVTLLFAVHTSPDKAARYAGEQRILTARLNGLRALAEIDAAKAIFQLALHFVPQNWIDAETLRAAFRNLL